MAVSLQEIIKITPGVLSAGGNAVDLNGLFLTNNLYAPNGALQTFSNSTDVMNYFGPASMEYALSQLYFAGYDNSNQQPGTLFFYPFYLTPVSAWLRSGSLASLTIANLALLSGSIDITVDGTAIAAASVSLTGATSFAAAAALIQTALGEDVVVTYDTVWNTFIITSATTGATSTITYATGTLATSLGLVTGVATISQGSAASVAATTMTAILTKTQDWATFSTTFACNITENLAFSAWTNGMNQRFAFVEFDTDAQAIVSGSETNFAYECGTLNSYEGTVPTYGNQTHAAAIMGYAASLDFNQLNGRRPLMFRSLSGLITTVSDNPTYETLQANGYNFYASFSSNNYSGQFWGPGVITGDFLWLDAYLAQIWLNANLMQDIITLFRSETYLPYNSSGQAQIEACMADTLTTFLNWGGMSIGTTLASSQVQAIKNAVGIDVSSSLTAKGFYLYIGPFTATMRANRTTPEVTLWYADGGFIQQLNMSSIEVQ